MAYDLGLQYSAARARSRTLNDTEIKNIVTVAGWVRDSGQATCIVKAESGGRTAITSSNPAGGQNIGLFQIWQGNVTHPEYLKDPVYNANVARRMWREDQWNRWATKGQCPAGTPAPPLEDEAQGQLDPDIPGVSGLPDIAGNIGSAIQNALSSLLNSIPWFRIGKGALGYVLLIMGIGALGFAFTNKALNTPAGKAAMSVVPAGKATKALKAIK
jgi:hypothetical protein